MEDSLTSLPTSLETVNEEKDLGVWCTNDLKPSLQCREAAAKASQVLGLIRSLKINSVDMLVFLYKMYVRPHLEYCVQVCNPYLTKDIDVQKVQRHATKFLHGLSHLSFVERLASSSHPDRTQHTLNTCITLHYCVVPPHVQQLAINHLESKYSCITTGDDVES